MNLFKIVGFIMLASGLVACATSPVSTNPDSTSWGNYKCIAASENGQNYTGWSTSESLARRNAKRICARKAGQGCQILNCFSDS